MQKLLVFTNLPDRASAERLAELLVERRLAACVNILPPMVSVYRWKGVVEREAERQVVIKTSRDQVAALQARLGALHAYELPEFIVLTVDDGGAEYVKWIAEQTRPH